MINSVLDAVPLGIGIGLAATIIGAMRNLWRSDHAANVEVAKQGQLLPFSAEAFHLDPTLLDLFIKLKLFRSCNEMAYDQAGTWADRILALRARMQQATDEAQKVQFRGEIRMRAWFVQVWLWQLCDSAQVSLGVPPAYATPERQRKAAEYTRTCVDLVGMLTDRLKLHTLA